VVIPALFAKAAVHFNSPAQKHSYPGPMNPVTSQRVDVLWTLAISSSAAEGL
jgi:hypothetical protein